MSFKRPAGRLPAHLQRRTPDGTRRETQRPAPDAQQHEPAPPGPGGEERYDRIREILPVILSALIGRAATAERRNAFTRADVQAVLAPYHRPNSLFTQRVLRRLVGEGYLRPQGERDKQGYSGLYLLTPAGEKLSRAAP